MKIRLEHPAPGIPEVRRALEEHAELCTKAITNFDRQPTEEIHEIRTRMKKIRALVKLLPLKRKSKRAKTIRKLIRKLKDDLASNRDDYVLRKAYASLSDHEATDTQTADPPPPSDLIIELLVAAERLRAKISTIPDNLCKPKHLRRNYLETYRSGRKAMRKAAKKNSPEAFHEWRKRVKDLWYQSSTFSTWEKNLQLVDAAKDLSDTLGELHDLDLLAERFSEFASTNANNGETNRKRLDQRRTELRSKALLQGEQLFARKTRELTRHLEKPTATPT